MLHNKELDPNILVLLGKVKQLQELALSMQPETSTSVLVAAVLTTLMSEIREFLVDDGDILPYILHCREWAHRRVEQNETGLKKPTHIGPFRIQ